MKLRAEEISSIIENQIASFDKKVEAQEVGTILSVGDGIARVHGLDNVKAMELLEFPGDVTGIALTQVNFKMQARSEYVGSEEYARGYSGYFKR